MEFHSNNSNNSNKRYKQVFSVFAGLALVGAGMGAASAQSGSDVTLYGLIDISLFHTSGKDGTGTGLMDGTLYGPGSRWGLRVREELGSGLSAGAVMESGFSGTTGRSFQDNRLFGRQVFLWLKSDQFGELRLGRQYMLHDETQAAFDAAAGGDTVISPVAFYTVTTGIFQTILSAPRIDNAVQLISPRVGGFQTKLMYAFGNETQDLYRAVKLDYTNGPLQLVAAHERGSSLINPADGNPSVNKVTLFGGSYDFALVKLYAGYERVKDMTQGVGTQAGTLALPGLTGNAQALKAYTVGASMPVENITYAVSYVHSRFSDGEGGTVSVGRYGPSATVNLSKRTAIYSALAFASGDLKGHVREKRIVQLGLRHRF